MDKYKNNTIAHVFTRACGCHRRARWQGRAGAHVQGGVRRETLHHERVAGLVGICRRAGIPYILLLACVFGTYEEMPLTDAMRETLDEPKDTKTTYANAFIVVSNIPISMTASRLQVAGEIAMRITDAIDEELRIQAPRGSTSPSSATTPSLISIGHGPHRREASSHHSDSEDKELEEDEVVMGNNKRE